MNLVEEAVAGGFRRALSRLHLVAADMATKLVWLFLSVACVLGAFLVFLAVVQPPGGPPELAGVILLARALEAWPVLAGGLLVAACVSFLVWCVLEALVRSRIIGWARTGVGFRTVFWRFLTSGLLRRCAFVLSAAVLLVVLLGPALTGNSAEWTRTRLGSPWAWVGGGVVLVMVAFVLMLTDTLIRCDAIETLGGHVGAVVAAVSAIGLTEVAVRWAALMVTLIAVNVMPSPLGLIVAVPTVGLVLSLAHSYLLVVRYTAVDIIRQHIESSGITPTGKTHDVADILR